MTSESHVSDLVGLIYDAAGDPEGWPVFLNALADSCGATAAGLNFYPRDQAERWTVNPRADPDYTARYVQHYCRNDPTIQENMRLRPGIVNTDNLWEITPELRRTAFYNEWMNPQRISAGIRAVASADERGALLVSVQDTNPLDRSHAALLQQLLPHIARAARLAQRLAQADANLTSRTSVLDQLDQGILVVDAKSRVLFANAAAEELLSAGCGLRLRAEILQAGTPAESGALQALVAGCARSGIAAGAGGTIVVSRGPERSPLSVTVRPVRGALGEVHGRWPAAAVFVADPDRIAKPADNGIRDLFRLTRAEAALAVELAEGDGVQAAATRLGITRETARTHLKHIFEKTGTHRQTELVRLLAAASGGVRRP